MGFLSKFIVIMFFKINRNLYYQFVLSVVLSKFYYDKLFLWNGWPTKGIKPYFEPGPLSVASTIANLITNGIWTCAEPEFRLWWMKLYTWSWIFSTDTLSYGRTHKLRFISFFKIPFHIIFWPYCPNEIQDKHTLVRESYFSRFRRLQNNIKYFFTSNFYISNTILRFDSK